MPTRLLQIPASEYGHCVKTAGSVFDAMSMLTAGELIGDPGAGFGIVATRP
jgi:hypothetical protein